MSAKKSASSTTKARTALKAIRAFCMQCMGGSPAGIDECGDSACPFHSYRSGKALPAGKHKPTGTIKTYCREYCQAGEGLDEVKECAGNKPVHGADPCPVFPFRLGRNPNITSETRAKCRERAMKMSATGRAGFSKTTTEGGSGL